MQCLKSVNSPSNILIHLKLLLRFSLKIIRLKISFLVVVFQNSRSVQDFTDVRFWHIFLVSSSSYSFIRKMYQKSFDMLWKQRISGATKKLQLPHCVPIYLYVLFLETRTISRNAAKLHYQ